MTFSLSKRSIEEDFVVIDSQFPQKEPFGFRNIEINEYLRRLRHMSVYTMHPIKPGPYSWFSHGYGVTEQVYEENKKGYHSYFPDNNERIHYLKENVKYNFKLAYSFFLAETYVLLPFYEKNKIPFVFILYPGGAFGLNNVASDKMLEEIFKSDYFRGVIVSQKITKDYLIRKRLCDEVSISYIYGGLVQFKEEDILPKQYFKKDKETFDICFVAAKYTDEGVDKGYDAFIHTAKILAKQSKDILFHVVGNFTKDDIDVTELGSRIIFYGYQKSSFFPEFYAKMDIMISPNRPHKLYEGNFDGFPLAVDAGYCGVAMFVSDPLDMNEAFTNHHDIVIIPVNPKKIAEMVMRYYTNTKELYKLSEAGAIASRKLFSIEHQVGERLSVFNKIYNREYKKGIE